MLLKNVGSITSRCSGKWARTHPPEGDECGLILPNSGWYSNRGEDQDRTRKTAEIEPIKNADVRRCSYFALGLPVLSVEAKARRHSAESKPIGCLDTNTAMSSKCNFMYKLIPSQGPNLPSSSSHAFDESVSSQGTQGTSQIYPIFFCFPLPSLSAQSFVQGHTYFTPCFTCFSRSVGGGGWGHPNKLMST